MAARATTSPEPPPELRRMMTAVFCAPMLADIVSGDYRQSTVAVSPSSLRSTFARTAFPGVTTRTADRAREAAGTGRQGTGGRGAGVDARADGVQWRPGAAAMTPSTWSGSVTRTRGQATDLTAVSIAPSRPLIRRITHSHSSCNAVDHY